MQKKNCINTFYIFISVINQWENFGSQPSVKQILQEWQARCTAKLSVMVAEGSDEESCGLLLRRCEGRQISKAGTSIGASTQSGWHFYHYIL